MKTRERKEEGEREKDKVEKERNMQTKWKIVTDNPIKHPP
jgi:hypothetical protein